MFTLLGIIIVFAPVIAAGLMQLILAAAQHTLIPRSLHSARQNARTAALIIRILQKRTFSQPETFAEKEMDKGMAMMVISIVTGIIAAVLVHMQEKERRSKLK